MTVYEREYRVDSRETDPWYNCRPSGVLGFLQEAATAAACALHASRDEMLDKYNAFWMLARVWYRLDEPLKWGERLRIRTWHRGGRGGLLLPRLRFVCQRRAGGRGGLPLGAGQRTDP